MPVDKPPAPEERNCFAVRAAARHITLAYDQFLAPTGLRTTQFSILAKLKRSASGLRTIAAFALTASRPVILRSQDRCTV